MGWSTKASLFPWPVPQIIPTMVSGAGASNRDVNSAVDDDQSFAVKVARQNWRSLSSTSKAVEEIRVG